MLRLSEITCMPFWCSGLTAIITMILMGCSSRDLPSPSNCNCSVCYVTVVHPVNYVSFNLYRTVRITDYDKGSEIVNSTIVNGPGVTWPVPASETFKVDCCKRLKIEVFYANACNPPSFGISTIYAGGMIISPQACTVTIYPTIGFYYSDC